MADTIEQTVQDDKPEVSFSNRTNCSIVRGMSDESRYDSPVTTFAQRLTIVRRNYGARIGRPRISKTEFASALGIEAPRYGRYEKGTASPPLEVLARIRALTGVSLCALIAGMSVGDANLIVNQAPPPKLTIGQHLRWAREILEPDPVKAAAVMRIPIARWKRYERSDFLPTKVAIEFAHRFGVTLDYLYRGDLSRVAPRLKRELIARHPQLVSEPTKHSGRNRMARGEHNNPESSPAQPENDAPQDSEQGPDPKSVSNAGRRFEPCE